MAKLRIKPGAQPYHFMHMLASIANVAAPIGFVPEVWITEGFGGLHSPKSLHYALRALDVRTKNFPTNATKDQFVLDLKAELGPDYDVILESIGQPQEHVHLEYDPR